MKNIECPKCGRKTRVKIRGDTTLHNYILFCHWCKKETIVDVEHGEIIKESVAEQSV